MQVQVLKIWGYYTYYILLRTKRYLSSRYTNILFRTKRYHSSGYTNILLRTKKYVSSRFTNILLKTKRYLSSRLTLQIEVIDFQNILIKYIFQLLVNIFIFTPQSENQEPLSNLIVQEKIGQDKLGRMRNEDRPRFLFFFFVFFFYKYFKILFLT